MRYTEEKLGKKILIVIDDLDKMAPKQAEELFYGYSTVLTGLDCNLIYTMPRALMFSDIHDFIRIIRESAVKAYENDRDRIEKEDVNAYVVDQGNDYLRILTGKDFDILREVTDKHEKTDEDRFRELLFNLAILEYLDPEGELWYDVHPVVKGVLD